MMEVWTETCCLFVNRTLFYNKSLFCLSVYLLLNRFHCLSRRAESLRITPKYVNYSGWFMVVDWNSECLLTL